MTPMARLLTVVAALALSGLPSSLAACGGSTSSASPNDASASDVGAPDAQPQREAGPSADAGDAAPADDDAATEDAGDAGDAAACATLASSACLSCCEGFYPTGFKKFGALELACGCAADLCGPPDGGADGGADDGGSTDGGVFGNDVCSVTCTAHTSPDNSCLTCLRATLGSTSAPGPCGVKVVSACIGDSDCKGYFACVENCPP